MNTISIAIADEQMLKLNEMAKTLNLSLEDLIQLSIEDLLAQPDVEFQRSADYLLDKNCEIYKRLAR